MSKFQRLLLAASFAASIAAAAAGCKSATTPTKPDPEPAGGRVELVQNASEFRASVRAGFDCQDDREYRAAADDFDPIDLSFDISCSAFAQDEGHSANVELDASLLFDHDGPEGGLSRIRFVAEAICNRSATGLAGNAALSVLKLRWEVRDEPVAYRVVGLLAHADHFHDRMALRRLPVVPGEEIHVVYGRADGIAGEVPIDFSGVLPVGTYEFEVSMDTHDWFTETTTMTVTFGATPARPAN